MEKIELVVEVPKEIGELGLGIECLLKGISKSLADGILTPIEVFNFIRKDWDVLVEAARGVNEIPVEFKADKLGSASGLLIPTLRGVNSFFIDHE